ncbi:hypothetical protein Q5M85_21195 [Paraclostridium bifermentans]|nr:hypothetical protein [Paraclostridium bifermentans]
MNLDITCCKEIDNLIEYGSLLDNFAEEGLVISDEVQKNFNRYIENVNHESINILGNKAYEEADEEINRKINYIYGDVIKIKKILKN